MAETRHTKDGAEITPGIDGTPLFYESMILPGQIKGGAFWDGQNVRCKLWTTQGTDDGNLWTESLILGTMPTLRPEDCFSSREAGFQHIESEGRKALRCLTP